MYIRPSSIHMSTVSHDTFCLAFTSPISRPILSTACKVRAAAVCALTRRELATDEIAAHACGLLGDENPRLRQKVLRRLGSLMKESR